MSNRACRQKSASCKRGGVHTRGIAIGEFNRERGIHVSPGTIVTRWQGERMDYSMAMDGLLAARARTAIAQAVRGET